jgi:hypothetical protein
VKRATLFAILCLACVSGLFVLFIFPDIFHNEKVGSFEISGMNYNSRGVDHEPYRKVEDTDSSTYDSEQIEITMLMRPYSDRKFGNVFQTAMANAGVRLELSPPHTLALVAGATDKPGYTAYVLTSALSLNKWHTFHLKINRTNHVLVEVDGVPLVNGRNSSLNYGISEIAIGTGFNETRPFDGEIRDASLAYSFYKKSTGSSVQSSAAKGVLAILSLAFLFLFIAEGRRKESAGS